MQGSGSEIYRLSQYVSSPLTVLDTSTTLSSETVKEGKPVDLPFVLNLSTDLNIFATDDGLSIALGNCSNAAEDLQIWTYKFNGGHDVWQKGQPRVNTPSSMVNSLAVTFTLPSVYNKSLSDLYTFGGLCNTSVNDSHNTSNTSYSDRLITASMESADQYEIAEISSGTRPVAEAGLCIIKLKSATSTNGVTDMLFISGHTASALVSMTRLAILSMPGANWRYMDVAQRTGTEIQARSGHTSVLSSDGLRVYVFGGWYGTPDNPAVPQMVVLNMNADHNGKSDWNWVIPSLESDYLSTAAARYGHGAIMLPGDVMMISGGFDFPNKSTAQKSSILSSSMFFNTTSSTWSKVYHPPGTTQPLNFVSTEEHSALIVGIVLGLAAAAILVTVSLFYLRSNRNERKVQAVAFWSDVSTSSVKPPSAEKGRQDWDDRTSYDFTTVRHRSALVHNKHPVPITSTQASEYEDTQVCFTMPKTRLYVLNPDSSSTRSRSTSSSTTI